jgi:hypothetical protein
MAAEEIINKQGFEGRVTVGMNNVSAIRTFLVDGLPSVAVYDADLPEIGDELPGWSGPGSPVCTERMAEPLDCDQSKVTCNYSRLIPGEGDPDDPTGEQNVDEIDIMTQRAHIVEDLDGDEIGQHSEGADIDIPKVVWTATRYSDSLEVGTIARLVSHVNATSWNGGNPRDWIFLGARAMRSGTSQWRITFYFGRDLADATTDWADILPGSWKHRAYWYKNDGTLDHTKDHRVYPDGNFYLLNLGI